MASAAAAAAKNDPTTAARTAPPAPDADLSASEDEEDEKANGPPPHPLSSVLQPGLRVEVKYMGRGEWVRAVVVEVGEGRQGLKVQYDGGEETNVNLDSVRLPGGALMGKSHYFLFCDLL